MKPSKLTKAAITSHNQDFAASDSNTTKPDKIKGSNHLSIIKILLPPTRIRRNLTRSKAANTSHNQDFAASD